MTHASSSESTRKSSYPTPKSSHCGLGSPTLIMLVAKNSLASPQESFGRSHIDSVLGGVQDNIFGSFNSARRQLDLLATHLFHFNQKSQWLISAFVCELTCTAIAFEVLLG